MIVYPSRRVRPTELRPLELTARDDAIFASVYNHRFLAARHIAELHFAGRSLRAAQKRLRRLWSHGFFDRAFIPTVLLGEGSDVPHTGGPLYCLAEPGARRLSEVSGIAYREIPSTPAQNRVGFATLCHHLVGTDWLVALEVAVRNSGVSVRTVRERTLRRLAVADKRLLVPDAAAELRLGERTAWCYLEVVRADPRGGSKTVRAKMKRYVQLNHERLFRRGYGHHPLRRVLFVTPTAERRDRMCKIAQQLEHGASLFAFASYEARPSLSEPSGITPDTVFDAVWHAPGSDAPSSLLSLLFDLAPCPETGRQLSVPLPQAEGSLAERSRPSSSSGRRTSANTEPGSVSTDRTASATSGC